MSEVKRIGLFGGSFNPIHNGHIHLAKSLREELCLDTVYLIPAKIPPHKSGSELASPVHRLNMCRLAAAENKGFEVSDYELCSERISYSLYTVRHFAEKEKNAEITLFVGSDMLLCFDKWFGFEQLLSMTRLAVASRNPDDYGLLSDCADRLTRDFGAQIYISNAKAYPVSSTVIRQLIKKQENFSCYLPESVVQYVIEHNLYL